MSNLQVDSVLKSFGTKQVLTDIYFTCSKGEILGLLGRNGSGKSTLLKIIFGIQNAENKYVKIGNKQINSVTDVYGLIKYLPQDNFLPKHVRFETVIPLFCTAGNAEKLKNIECLKPLLKKKGGRFSGGEIRVAEILLLVYSDAEFVLLDEPFNGISPILNEEIKKHIREQAAFKGFILTDHDFRNTIDVATRTLLLHDGGMKAVQNEVDLKEWGYLP